MTMAPIAVDSAWPSNSISELPDSMDLLKQPSPCDPLRTLPARWMRDEAILDLEKRAIFSKVWLFTSHTSHFEKPGDYISGNYIYDFFIIRDKDDHYQAFHNVCRHRAYPVVSKSSGSTLILGCKYHGWSYNSKGELVKAPKYDEVEGFDKSANGLMKIHTHVTSQGMIFINFDSSPSPVSFDEHFGHLTKEWVGHDFNVYEPFFTRVIVGNFNWKTMMDGYQECYHCSIAHPGFAKSLDLKNYRVEPLTNSSRHSAPKRDSPDDLQGFTFVFPTNGMTVTPELWYIMRTVPLNARQTRMEYQYFGRKGIPREELEALASFFTKVQMEDYELCEKTQRNLNAGIYETGILHPKVENGVLYYQNQVLRYCEEHLKAERKAGKEIHPALHDNSDDSSRTCQANRLCSEAISRTAVLSW